MGNEYVVTMQDNGEILPGEKITNLDQLFDMLVEVVGVRVESESALLERFGALELELRKGLSYICDTFTNFKRTHQTDMAKVQGELGELQDGLFENWKVTAENRAQIEALLTEIK